MLQVDKAVRWLAQQAPGRLAVIDEHTELSYKELHQTADQWAYVLHSRGVSPGGTVIILMNNCVQFVQTVLALERLHVRIVLINSQLSNAEISSICQNVGAQLLITEQKYSNVMQDIGDIHPFFHQHILYKEEIQLDQMKESGLKLEVLTDEHVERKEQDTIVFFTSGSTGKPKGIVMEKRAFDIGQSNSITPAVHLIARPLYYRAHFSSISFMLQEGKTIILCSQVIPDQLVQLIATYRTTHLILGPYDLLNLISWIEEKDTQLPESLQEIMSTGTTLSEKLKQKLGEHAKSISFIDLYGTSESGAISFIDHHEWEKKKGSVGRPLFFSRVAILDHHDRELPAYGKGEICVKTRFSMTSYFMDDLLNKEAFIGEYIRTGDIGYMDEDGYLYLLGRKDNSMNRLGNVFSLSEVELFLSQHQWVNTVAVVPVEDQFNIQVPVAYIELVKPFNQQPVLVESELKEYCQQHLASYKIPARFIFVDQFPLTSAGKVDRKLLKVTY